MPSVNSAAARPGKKPPGKELTWSADIARLTLPLRRGSAPVVTEPQRTLNRF